MKIIGIFMNCSAFVESYYIKDSILLDKFSKVSINGVDTPFIHLSYLYNCNKEIRKQKLNRLFKNI